MLLFKKFLIEKILSGEKIETRRLWEKARVKLNSIQSVQPDLRSSFKKEPPVCYVKIKSLHRELLSDITPEGVIHEGFPDGDVKKFIAGFKEINAKKVKTNGLLPEGISLEDWNPNLFVVGFGLWQPDNFQRLL